MVPRAAGRYLYCSVGVGTGAGAGAGPRFPREVVVLEGVIRASWVAIAAWQVWQLAPAGSFTPTQYPL